MNEETEQPNPAPQLALEPLEPAERLPALGGEELELRSGARCACTGSEGGPGQARRDRVRVVAAGQTWACVYDQMIQALTSGVARAALVWGQERAAREHVDGLLDQVLVMAGHLLRDYDYTFTRVAERKVVEGLGPLGPVGSVPERLAIAADAVGRAVREARSRGGWSRPIGDHEVAAAQTGLLHLLGVVRELVHDLLASTNASGSGACIGGVRGGRGAAGGPVGDVAQEVLRFLEGACAGLEELTKDQGPREGQGWEYASPHPAWGAPGQDCLTQGLPETAGEER